jgi:hypothetical protein
MLDGHATPIPNPLAKVSQARQETPESVSVSDGQRVRSLVKKKKRIL